ncbi:MAG: YchJ family protein [Sulfurimonas sp.]|nr:YchJ family protein [Sulfurimonas sp.]
MLCYCKSKKEFSECCEPFLAHAKKPSTSQELMRSRYSAYVLGDGKYLVETTTQENRYENDITLIEEYSRSVTWLSLEIVSFAEDIVEFKAYYRDTEGVAMQHEKSFFVKEDGLWLYKEGIIYNSKIERNIPCPCGSGKKYKKCCA